MKSNNPVVFRQLIIIAKQALRFFVSYYRLNFIFNCEFRNVNLWIVNF